MNDKGTLVFFVLLLPIDITRENLTRLVGASVLLGARPFRLRGVDCYAIPRLRASTPVGLLGEYADGG
jgi:hypothetical protein